MRIGVVIPAKNEAASIALVLAEIPAQLDALVVVVDNASTDRTAEIARDANVHVIREERRGYGRVVLTGVEYLSRFGVDVVVILDGDFSDYPALMNELVQPIQCNTHDMVLSTRLNPLFEKDSLPTHVIYGNKLVVALMNRLFATDYTDMGPFRAIRLDHFMALHMQDRDYGWNVEMQVKARLIGLRVTEVSVPYRRRRGKSKISGTLSGSVHAGSKMFFVLAKLYLQTRSGGVPELTAPP